MRRMLNALGATLICTLVGSATALAAPAEPVPGYSAMGPAPAGANDWNCKTTPAHPRPVVLVHGTGESMVQTWSSLSPKLKAQGLCVFALNYGASRELSHMMQLSWGTGEVHASAAQLATFITAVKSATHSSQVDVVGHSQGGMLPRLVLQAEHSRTPSIRHLIAMAPSSGGAFFGSEQSLADQAALQLGVPVTLTRSAFPMASQQQMAGSPLINQLRTERDVRPDVDYTNIASRLDTTVPPPAAFMGPRPNVHNVLLQDGCAANHASHLMFDDARAEWIVQQALDPAWARTHHEPCP